MKLKSILAAALLAPALVLLTACGPKSGTPDAASSGGGGSPDRDSCLIGTWQVDVNDLAHEMVGMMQSLGGAAMSGATATSDGTITVVFGDSMTITYGSVITLNSSAGSLPIVEKITYSGSAKSDDWTAKNGAIKGTMSSNDFKIEMTETMAGQPIPLGTLPVSGGMDLGAGNVSYTCSGGSGTISVAAPNPVSSVTWKLTRSA